MAFKTYVLLEHMHPHNKNMFVRTSKTQRVVQDKLPMYCPYLQITLTDEKEESKTIRYKENTKEILQSEQIKAGIPANDRFTTAERRALVFKNGAKTTDRPGVQKYLEAYPGFEGFKGYCTDVPRREYKIYDKEAETKVSNVTTRRRLEAGNKIFDLDLKGSQDLLYRIYGTSYKPSDSLETNQNILVDYLDGSDEAISEILKSDINRDDEAKILVGKLLTAGILAFDKNLGQVSKRKNNYWIDVKAISSEYSFDERKRHFIEFITSDAGKTLWNDLEKDLQDVSKISVVEEKHFFEISKPIQIVNGNLNVPIEKVETNGSDNPIKKIMKRKIKKRKVMRPKKYSNEQVNEAVEESILQH